MPTYWGHLDPVPMFTRRCPPPRFPLRLLFAWALALPAAGLSAQIELRRTVLSAGGALAATPRLSAAGTLGEPVVGTVRGARLTLTQGFQQPDARSGGPSATAEVAAALELHPNPASLTLTVSLPPDLSPDSPYLVTDLGGRAVLRGSAVAGDRLEIDVSGLAPGTYLLRLARGRQLYRSVFVVAP